MCKCSQLFVIQTRPMLVSAKLVGTNTNEVEEIAKLPLLESFRQVLRINQTTVDPLTASVASHWLTYCPSSWCVARTDADLLRGARRSDSCIPKGAVHCGDRCVDGELARPKNTWKCTCAEGFCQGKKLARKGWPLYKRHALSGGLVSLQRRKQSSVSIVSRASEQNVFAMDIGYRHLEDF